MLYLAPLAPTSEVNCVHLLYPEAHGAVGLVAAGCRDSSVFLWRRRGQRGTQGESRSMRENIVYRLDGHKVVHPSLSLIITGTHSRYHPRDGCGV